MTWSGNLSLNKGRMYCFYSSFDGRRKNTMSERHSSFGDFLTGMLVGGAVGYVIALLNAPRPGDETRQMLTERGMELRDRAMETVQTTMDKTGKLVADSRQRLGTQVG